MFWDRVIPNEDCWDWTGNLTVAGRPRFKSNGKTYAGHRVSYEIHKRIIPRNLCVCHTCDNPKCCNPDHLWLGTHAENQHDCFLKGRRAKGLKNGHYTKPESTARGEQHKRSKLIENDVRKILKIGATMPQRQIGEMFNTPQTNISRILRREAWKHVTS